MASTKIRLVRAGTLVRRPPPGIAGSLLPQHWQVPADREAMDRVGERWSVYRLGERFLKRLWRTLPKGRSLPEEIWRRRHRGILVLLWAQVLGIACFGVLRGHGLVHSLSEAAVVAAIALMASRQQLARGLQSGAATVGLVTCSAILVHLSGGAIEMHFHFFVMVGAASDATPLRLCASSPATFSAPGPARGCRGDCAAAGGDGAMVTARVCPTARGRTPGC